MKNKTPSEIIPGSPVHKQAQALSLSVAAIRKAQGRQNPGTFRSTHPSGIGPAWNSRMMC
jgi:hypothetical protein